MRRGEATAVARQGDFASVSSAAPSRGVHCDIFRCARSSGDRATYHKTVRACIGADKDPAPRRPIQGNRTRPSRRGGSASRRRPKEHRVVAKVKCVGDIDSLVKPDKATLRTRVISTQGHRSYRAGAQWSCGWRSGRTRGTAGDFNGPGGLQRSSTRVAAGAIAKQYRAIAGVFECSCAADRPGDRQGHASIGLERADRGPSENDRARPSVTRCHGLENRWGTAAIAERERNAESRTIGYI